MFNRLINSQEIAILITPLCAVLNRDSAVLNTTSADPVNNYLSHVETQNLYEKASF